MKKSFEVVQDMINVLNRHFPERMFKLNTFESKTDNKFNTASIIYFNKSQTKQLLFSVGSGKTKEAAIENMLQMMSEGFYKLNMTFCSAEELDLKLSVLGIEADSYL
jgi:hypothetical protein